MVDDPVFVTVKNTGAVVVPGAITGEALTGATVTP
jgi:hypothetical protein